MILVFASSGTKAPVRGDVIALRSAPTTGDGLVLHEGAPLYRVGETGADGLVSLEPAFDVQGRMEGLVHFFSREKAVRVPAAFLEGAPVLFHGDVWRKTGGPRPGDVISLVYPFPGLWTAADAFSAAGRVEGLVREPDDKVLFQVQPVRPELGHDHERLPNRGPDGTVLTSNGDMAPAEDYVRLHPAVGQEILGDGRRRYMFLDTSLFVVPKIYLADAVVLFTGRERSP